MVNSAYFLLLLLIVLPDHWGVVEPLTGNVVRKATSHEDFMQRAEAQRY